MAYSKLRLKFEQEGFQVIVKDGRGRVINKHNWTTVDKVKNNMNEQKLLDLKRKIEQAKTRKAELTGKRDGLMETLQKKWKCGSVEEAEKLIQQKEDEIAELEKKRDKGIKELQEKYDL